MAIQAGELERTTGTYKCVSVSFRVGPYAARVHYCRSPHTGGIMRSGVTAAGKLPADVARELEAAAAKYLARNILSLKAALTG